MALHLDRKPAVLERRGTGNTALYRDIADGVWTAPVHLGRCSAWPRHEVDALIAARVAGATAEQLRQLVEQLYQERRALMPQIGTPAQQPAQAVA